ncbi:hypothetical protein A4H97_24000 [Niastella yeongjuensis]|uniref:Lipocalin-like domain-containing protein n=1 Tax=Niastella yeongjuensis TaxID=354355 RepID=A0A1V9F364_9BACT|nr:hypothetical protein [Niastella yeongjuensis]OQP52771.1 hypothetical protein A4H97_24000 [Niastella yeongjuensis]SEP19301.1 hypothetical protein SAMN05660816_04687 [Niastella yeongjuensis]
MKSIAVPITLITWLFYASCTTKKAPAAITGTWRLLIGTLIEKGDTTVTDYTSNKQFIKIINDTHFAFLSHDLNKGKDSANALFTAGGGKYSIKDSIYTEHLEYCNAREWENNDFTFTVSIKNDTLIQQGVEKIEGSNINRLNIEKYVRLR